MASAGPAAGSHQALANLQGADQDSIVAHKLCRRGVRTSLPTAVLSIAPELVMLDLPVTSHQLWMVRHRDVGKSARIRKVEDWLRQIFDPRTQPWYRAEFIHPSEIARFPNARRAMAALR